MHGIPAFYSFPHHIVLGSPQKLLLLSAPFFSLQAYRFFHAHKDLRFFFSASLSTWQTGHSTDMCMCACVCARVCDNFVIVVRRYGR